MEAYIALDCSVYSENIVDVLKAFQQIGWGIYNPQGKIAYLPVGDGDNFDWQREEMPETRLYDIVFEKTSKKELVGVELFYNNGVEGVSFLADATDQILLSIDYNRRIRKERHTDMGWYLENIIYKLLDAGIRVFSYTLKEYED